MGNVYMEAEQVRFKNSTYRNLQTAVSAALEGGGGGGTTVIANPEGSATADLIKLQVGETVYGIPENIYFDTVATLSTSGTTTVTFTESEILATSVVDIAISVWGIVPDDVVVSAGSCVITMPQVETAVTVSIRLYVK